VYTRFTGGGSDHAPATLAMRVSADGGRTWSEDRTLVEREGVQNVMSVSIVRLPSGELLLFYLVKNACDDCRMRVRRSSDEFETLSEPVLVTTEPGYHVVNNDRVLRLRSGRLVVPAGLHPCLKGEKDTKETFSRYSLPRVYYSDDDGRSWRRDETFTDEFPAPGVVLQEPGIVELKDGRLRMWFRTDAGVQYECFSSDGGGHWSEPGPGVLASPVSPASIERIPWTGDLICVWNDHSGWHVHPPKWRTPLCVAISRDDGRSWSPSRVIEGHPEGWYCYTSISFIGQEVVLSYCAGRDKAEGLTRLKVLALPRAWLYLRPASMGPPASSRPEG
jgi:sialidase-1